MSEMAITSLVSRESFEKFIKSDNLSVVHFYATWTSTCDHVTRILIDLMKKEKNFSAAILDVEGIAEVSHAYGITAVPTVVFFKNGKDVDRCIGFNPDELSTKIVKYSFYSSETLASDHPVSKDVQNLNERLETLIKRSRLMVFMKGTPESPRCGFSRQLISILNDLKADFSTFDILSDEEIRQGLKEYSSWPTYPQVYLEGKLIGGLDILKEEVVDSSFVDKLPKKKMLDDHLKELIRKSKLMIFMKGTPDSPKCKFSKELVQLLNNVNAAYSSFDVLADDEVRQGLKKFSNWPTYPQVYLDGSLIGGIDILKEELTDPSFVQSLPKKI